MVARTFTVTTPDDIVSGNDDLLSLREAVARANANPGADRIVFAAGLEGQVLKLTGGELVLTGEVSIDGDGNGDGVGITIDADLGSRIFNAPGSDSAVVLHGLTLTGGHPDLGVGPPQNGGAILLGGGSLLVSDTTITGSDAYFAVGGAIYAGDGSRVTILRSSIMHNHAYGGTSGGIAGGRDVTLTVRDSNVSDNRANYGGIGIDLGLGGSLTVEDSRISDNFAEEGGGRGVFVEGSATVSRTTVSGNYGGGIFAGQLTLTDSTVANNDAGGAYGGSGGGIRAEELTVRNSTITGNRAAGFGEFIAHGGGILADHVDIANSIVAGNVLAEDSSGSPDIFGTIVASDGHNIFGSDADGNVAGDRENVPTASLFAALDPRTGGGLLGPSGIVLLLNDRANPAVSAADLLAASTTGQLGAARPLPAGSLPDLGAVEIGQPLSTRASANNDVLTGTASADTINGLAGADYIKGLGGKDTLHGNQGSDLLDGGPGNDKLYGDAGIDLLFYGDSKAVRVDLSLATDKATRGTEVDTLYAVEGAIGSSKGDSFIGDDGANWFQGGLGKDTATGKGGRDLYDYDSVSDSPAGAATRDVIRDFVHLVDKIDLMGIDADATLTRDQAFRWVGTDPLTGPGEVGYFTSGGNTIVQASTDADSAAEFQIQLTGIKALTAVDFYL